MKSVRLLSMTCVLALAAFSATAAIAQNEASGQAKAKTGSAKTGASSMDSTFVKEAAQGGLAEVELGNLAKSSASNDAVKKFGDRMVTDHSKANDELKSLAGTKGWTLPTDMSPQQKAMKTRLSKLSGAEFDKSYMRFMVRDHEKDVAHFKKCASSCSDPDLKAWAGKTAPILEEHLTMAKDTASQVGASSGKSEKSEKKSEKSEKSAGKQ